MALSNNDDVDTGISYRASTPNLQKLLDKVKARKRAAGETPNRNSLLMNYRAMSAKLDDLIELEYAKGVLQSVWRKLKKPSFKTMSKIRKSEGAAQREYERLTPHVEDIAKQLGKFKFSSKPSDLIEFAKLPRPHKYARALGLGKPLSGTQKLLGIGAIGVGAGVAGVGGYRMLDKHYKKQARESQEFLDRVDPHWRYRKPDNEFYRTRPIDRHGLDKATIEQLNRQNLSVKLNDLIQFADPRPRNQLGEFSPQGEGGPDPNAMVKTYRIAPNQPGMAPNKNQGSGLAGIAGLGLVGGAAGATGAEAAKGSGRALQKLARRLGYMKG